MNELKKSPLAAADLMEQIQGGEAEMEEGGTTDCREGCFVEPDGHCCHGYESALITLGLI